MKNKGALEQPNGKPTSTQQQIGFGSAPNLEQDEFDQAAQKISKKKMDKAISQLAELFEKKTKK